MSAQDDINRNSGTDVYRSEPVLIDQDVVDY